MSSSGLFWICCGALLATGIARWGVCSLRNFSRHDLAEICRRRKQESRLGQVLRLHEHVALGIEMIVAFTTALAVVSGGYWVAQRGGSAQEIEASRLLQAAGLMGALLAICATTLPWTGSRLFASRFLFFTWPLWETLALLVAPLNWVARLIDTSLHRIAGKTPQQVDEETLEEEIRTIVSEGLREGLLEEDAREMIEGVMELGDADVSEIMTTRTDMSMLQVDMPWDDILAEMIKTGHTRTPVFDKNRDDIIGVLYSKDLLPELATGDPQSRTPLRELLRKVVFVPETKPVDNVLQMFQKTHNHIAVVLDEYGGVSGLVTIEDVLEEIVGEIVDEYDEEVVEEIRHIDEDSCEALGRAHVDAINDAMNLSLPEDGDFDTIGGFVLTELGRVPLTGESLVWQKKVCIRVLEASKRRIDRVLIERLGNGQRDGR